MRVLVPKKKGYFKINEDTIAYYLVIKGTNYRCMEPLG